MALFQSGFMLCDIFSCLEDYHKRKSALGNVAGAQNIVQHVFVCGKFGSDKAMKYSFLIIGWEKEKESVLWIAKILLLFVLKMQGNLAAKESAFLRYMQCTKSLDDIDRELGCLCIGWKTTE